MNLLFFYLLAQTLELILNNPKHVNSKFLSWAVVLCIITMLCWGSWANTQKMASKTWAFQLFYWDYAIGVFLLSLIMAFTFGSSGDEGRSFIQDLRQASGSSFGLALLGGVVFNLANILLVIAIDLAGMAVAFPLSIGLALVIGVVTNYVATPVGNPVILFVGVLLVAVAIILDAMAYRKKSSSEGTTTTKGIVISITAGVLMGFFYYFVAGSMITDFNMPEAGKFTPYSASVIFSIGLILSNFIWNTYFMYRPLSGVKATYKEYFTQGNFRLHLDRNAWRSHLEPGYDTEYHCHRSGRICHILWPWTGSDTYCGIVGRFHLEGI